MKQLIPELQALIVEYACEENDIVSVLRLLSAPVSSRRIDFGHPRWPLAWRVFSPRQAVESGNLDACRYILSARGATSTSTHPLLQFQSERARGKKQRMQMQQQLERDAITLISVALHNHWGLEPLKELITLLRVPMEQGLLDCAISWDRIDVAEWIKARRFKLVCSRHILWEAAGRANAQTAHWLVSRMPEFIPWLECLVNAAVSHVRASPNGDRARGHAPLAKGSGRSTVRPGRGQVSNCALNICWQAASASGKTDALNSVRRGWLNACHNVNVACICEHSGFTVRLDGTEVALVYNELGRRWHEENRSSDTPYKQVVDIGRDFQHYGKPLYKDSA